MEKKARLGRGLDALFGGTEETPGNGHGTAVVTIDAIDRNPLQPRKTFDEDEIAALSATIKEHGILQPLVVRAQGERYELIAGERRLRAARAAGLPTVPVTVVNFNDQQVLEAALIENIHRADLNPIEKAEGFKDYLTRFQMTHEQLAGRLGMARPTITNLVSLLELPEVVRDLIRTGQLSLGHAKVIKGIADPERQISVSKEVIARGLSVHATDDLIKQPASPEAESSGNGRAASAVSKTTHVQGIEDELRQRLATKVEIKLKAKDRGQIVLAFESNDDFERILEALRR